MRKHRFAAGHCGDANDKRGTDFSREREVVLKTRILKGAAVGALASSLLASPSGAIGQSAPQRGSLADIMTNPTRGGGLLLQPSAGVRGDLFKGCEDGAQPPASDDARTNPRSRIENARGANSNGTGRVFANVGADEQGNAQTSDPADDCWSRIDGLWVERGARPSFDKDFRAAGWGGGDTPELRALTHGVYTQPRFLVIEKSGDLNRHLIAKQPFLGTNKITFSSADSVGLTEALMRRGPAKRYRAFQAIRGLGRDLSVRVASNGVAVLELGGRQFVRPKAALSKTHRAAQPAMEDVFNRGDNIQYTDVLAQGFDVTTQNPNRFGDNNKDFVFAKKVSKDYYTKDRKIVPIDMALDLLSDQGSIYFSSLVSSASEIQNAYASSFGVSVQAGVSGSASNKKQTSSVNLEASVGYGSSFSNSQFSSLQNRQSVSQAIGFSRQKQFALIRDHAQSELDGFFRDAVVSAVESGNFSQIIRRYGTHYPYATTFGSSGQVRSTTTDEGYREVVSESSSDSESGGANLLIVQANVNSSNSSQNSSSFERNTQYGRAFFDAVGGNGSWNESGFSAGQSAYPILMDMRPLDELLNPINFPGQPMIYNQGRRALAAKIDDYLKRAGRRVSDISLLPEIIPNQRWTIRALSVNCHRAGSLEGNSDRIQLQGQMRLDVNYPSQKSRIVFSPGTGKKYRGMFCNGRNYTANNPKRFVLEGTASELARARYRIRTNFDEADFGSPIKALRVKVQGGLAQAVWPDKIFQGSSRWFTLPDESELNASGRLVRTYGVPGGAAGKQPDLRLRIEFHRTR